MRSPPPHALLLLLLFSLTHAHICRTTVQIPHSSVRAPFSTPAPTTIPLHLTHPCHPSPNTPLILLLQGALLRPRDYTLLTTLLTRAHFILATPHYTSRPLPALSPVVPALVPLAAHVNATIASGARCPPNSQQLTPRAINSTLTWFSAAGPRNTRPHHRVAERVRSAADLRHVLFVAHSLGSAAALAFLSDTCAPFASPVPGNLSVILRTRAGELRPRLLCEQYTRSTIPRVRVAGVVSFEGIPPTGPVTVPDGTFHVVIHTRFAGARYRNLSRAVTGGGRVLRVRVRRANHYGVNDFVDGGRQTPPCALLRRPPEDAFRVGRRAQQKTVRSVAALVVASYLRFVKGVFVGVRGGRIAEVEAIC